MITIEITHQGHTYALHLEQAKSGTWRIVKIFSFADLLLTTDLVKAIAKEKKQILSGIQKHYDCWGWPKTGHILYMGLNKKSVSNLCSKEIVKGPSNIRSLGDVLR